MHFSQFPSAKACRSLIYVSVASCALLLTACSNDTNDLTAMTAEHKAIEQAMVLSPAAISNGFIKGADISSLKAYESNGVKYFSLDGEELDALTLLKMSGFNYVRLRVNADPNAQAQSLKMSVLSALDKASLTSQALDLKSALELAKRAQDLNMKLMLELDYAYLTNEFKGQEQRQGLTKLKATKISQSLYNDSFKLIQAFSDAKIAPSLIEICSDLDFLSADLKAADKITDLTDFSSLTKSLNAAIKGITDGAKTSAKVKSELPKIVLTCAQGEQSGTRSDDVLKIVDSLVANKVAFDYVGLALSDDINSSEVAKTVALVGERFNKDVMVVQASFPYAGDNDAKQNSANDTRNNSVITQAKSTKDLLECVAQYPNGKGLFYFEPAAIDISKMGVAKPLNGDSHLDAGADKVSSKHGALFDDEGKLLPSVKVFRDLIQLFLTFKDLGDASQIYLQNLQILQIFLHSRTAKLAGCLIVLDS